MGVGTSVYDIGVEFLTLGQDTDLKEASLVSEGLKKSQQPQAIAWHTKLELHKTNNYINR